MLVGLASKNAILIVEFAKHLQEQGRDRVSAVLEAARLRLRPIVMTSIAFVMGVLPLVLADGAGSEVRRAMGAAVFSGMIGVTVFGLLLTPVFYVLLRRDAGEGAAARRLTRLCPMRKTRFLLAPLAAAILCCLRRGPELRGARNEAAEKFDSLEATYSAEPGASQFWQSFDDPELQKLVNEALASNHDLRIAVTRVQEARALRRDAAFDLAPSITAGGGYTKTRTSTAGTAAWRIARSRSSTTRASMRSGSSTSSAACAAGSKQAVPISAPRKPRCTTCR